MTLKWVVALIDNTTSAWDEQQLQNLFEEKVVDEILANPTYHRRMGKVHLS